MTNQEFIKRVIGTLKFDLQNHKSTSHTFVIDPVWTLTLEVFSSGGYRFWITREDKAGHYNNSLLTYERGLWSIQPRIEGYRPVAQFKRTKKVDLLLDRMFQEMIKEGLDV